MADPPPRGLDFRRLAAAVLGSALAGAASWIGLRNLGLPGHGGWIFWVPVTLWILTMAVLCCGYAVWGHLPASRAAIRASWRAGWRVGALGLAIGYIGPLVITPKATLGPLLGILLTGPVGFVVGALGAAVVRTVESPR